MTTPHDPESDNDDVVDVDPANPDAGADDTEGPDAAPEAPKGGLFEQITKLLGNGPVEAAKIEAMTLAAQGYAMTNRRAVEILDGLDAETQMALVEKGVSGIELSTFKKILLVVNPTIVLAPALLSTAWNAFKRNTLAKVIPDRWISDVSWLASQAEVVAMFSTGVVHAKTPEIAQKADHALENFLKNTGRAARVVEVGGGLLAQPEVVEGAELVKKGAHMAHEVVNVFPKVREKMEAKRAEEAEAAKAEVEGAMKDEHDQVAGDLEPQVHITPANTGDHFKQEHAA